jgi:uncharacterized protein YjbJ (UPF0337 family)
MINREILEGNWNHFKGRIQKKWSQLTDSDLAAFHGNVDELVGVIQKKTGEGREAVESFLQELSAGAGSFPGQAAQYVSQAAQSAREGVHQATETLRGSAHRAAEQFSEFTEGTECLVRDRPGLALAISFGVGILVGSLLTLKCRSA